MAEEIIDAGLNPTNEQLIHVAPVDHMTRYDFVKTILDYLLKNNKKFVHQDFKLEPITLQEIYAKGIMSDIRPTEPILIPSISERYTLADEIEKAISEYFRK